MNKPFGECSQNIKIFRKPKNLFDRRTIPSFGKHYFLAHIASLRVSKRSNEKKLGECIQNIAMLRKPENLFNPITSAKGPKIFVYIMRPSSSANTRIKNKFAVFNKKIKVCRNRENLFDRMASKFIISSHRIDENDI